jgi:single-strand DNA-binding protein
MRVNQWLRADDTPATSVEIDAYNVGHDLSYGTTSFTKVTRAQVDRTDRMSDDNVQAVHASFEPVDLETGEYLVRDGDAAPAPVEDLASA